MSIDAMKQVTDRELMQQALEKLEFFAHMKSVSEDTRRLITDLRKRLAQPVQKPVACLVETEQGVMVWPIEDYEEAETYCDEGEYPIKLYTAPQPAQQPLTDEQIDRLWGDAPTVPQKGKRREIARAAINEFCHINGLTLAHGITGEKK